MASKKKTDPDEPLLPPKPPDRVRERLCPRCDQPILTTWYLKAECVTYTLEEALAVLVLGGQVASIARGGKQYKWEVVANYYPTDASRWPTGWQARDTFIAEHRCDAPYLLGVGRAFHIAPQASPDLFSIALEPAEEPPRVPGVNFFDCPPPY